MRCAVSGAQWCENRKINNRRFSEMNFNNQHQKQVWEKFVKTIEAQWCENKSLKPTVLMSENKSTM